MAQLTLPADLYPQVAGFGLRQSSVQSRSVFTGALETRDLIGERWECSITWPPRLTREASSMEVLQNRLAGGIHELLMHHPARPVPRGTLRGSPLLQTTVTRGAQTLVINSVTNGWTLEPGDMLGEPGRQLFMVAAACVAASGSITVPLVNRVRATVTAGAAITWNRPTARFICPAMANPTVHRPGFAEGGALDLEERIT